MIDQTKVMGIIYPIILRRLAFSKYMRSYATPNNAYTVNIFVVCIPRNEIYIERYNIRGCIQLIITMPGGDNASVSIVFHKTAETM